jgi:integrase
MPFFSEPNCISLWHVCRFIWKSNKQKTARQKYSWSSRSEFVVHNLRRTCLTLMVSLGIREEVAEKCVNHHASNIVRIYNKYEYKQERKEAHEKVAKLILPMTNFTVKE